VHACSRASVEHRGIYDDRHWDIREVPCRTPNQTTRVASLPFLFPVLPPTFKPLARRPPCPPSCLQAPRSPTSSLGHLLCRRHPPYADFLRTLTGWVTGSSAPLLRMPSSPHSLHTCTTNRSHKLAFERQVLVAVSAASSVRVERRASTVGIRLRLRLWIGGWFNYDA
jgi:hypothetical protein